MDMVCNPNFIRLSMSSDFLSPKLANIPIVDAPETESLDFSDLIDGYRQYSGPANLARRRVISSECGAVRGEAYAQTLPEILWKVKRSYAGSVNQFVFHGFPYSGQVSAVSLISWKMMFFIDFVNVVW